jgi:pimeloyl-ACP methyl ester carboxylesterase
MFKAVIKEQSRCLPSAPVVVTPKAGHGSPYDNAVDFNAAVKNFLN